MEPKRLVVCSLLLCSIVLVRAGGAGAQTGNAESSRHPLDIRVTGGDWGHGQLRDIQEVCRSAAQELWRYFPNRQLHPIVVTRSHSGPIVLHERLEDGEYQIRLDSQNTYWAQFSFQFAHEFCHVLCCYGDEEHPNRWFEESLCELASLFAMRRMAETWKTSPPYPNWKSYAPHLKDYADKRIRGGRLPAGSSLAEWYGKNAQQLYRGPTQREKNELVAVALLPLFEKEPSRWGAVAYLNAGKGFKNQSFAEYMQEWHYFAPRKHKDFIKKITAMFDVAKYGVARPVPAATRPPVGGPLLIVKRGDWGGAALADIKAVLESARDEFCSNFTDKPTGTIHVVRGFNGPRIDYRSSPQAPYTACLDVSGSFWCQFAFQFVPTLCRLAMNFEELKGEEGKPHPYGWLHGALCHLSAVTTIRQMAASWKTDAPYPNWRSFASSLAKYAEDLTNDPQQRLPNGTTLGGWYEKNKTGLTNNASLWEKNGVVALALLPLFERNPAGWDAIRYMPSEQSATLRDYLARWREVSPRRHKAFVEEIASAFGIEPESERESKVVPGRP